MERQASSGRQALAARVAASAAAAASAGSELAPRTVSVLSRDALTGEAVETQYAVPASTPQATQQQQQQQRNAAATPAIDRYEAYMDTPETRQVASEVPRLLKLAMQLSESAEAQLPGGAAPVAGAAVTRQQPGKARAGEVIFLKRAQLAAELNRMGLSPMVDWSAAGLKFGKVVVASEQQEPQTAARPAVPRAASLSAHKGASKGDGAGTPGAVSSEQPPAPAGKRRPGEQQGSTREQLAARKVQQAVRNPILMRARQAKGQMSKLAKAQAAAGQQGGTAGDGEDDEEWVGGGGSGLPRYSGDVVVVDGSRPLALDSVPTLRPYYPRRRREGPLANEEEGGTMAPHEILRRQQQQQQQQQRSEAAPAAAPGSALETTAAGGVKEPKRPRRRQDRLLGLARALVAAHKRGVLNLGIDLGAGPEPTRARPGAAGAPGSPASAGGGMRAAPRQTGAAGKGGATGSGVSSPARAASSRAHRPGPPPASRPARRSSKADASAAPDAPRPVRKPSPLALVTDLSDVEDVWRHRACSSEDESWGVESDDADSQGFPRLGAGDGVLEGGAGEAAEAPRSGRKEEGGGRVGEGSPSRVGRAGERPAAGPTGAGGVDGGAAGALGYESSGSWGIDREDGASQQRPDAQQLLEALFQGLAMEGQEPDMYRPPEDGSIPDVRFSQIPGWLVEALPWYEPGTPAEPLPWGEPGVQDEGSAAAEGPGGRGDGEAAEAEGEMQGGRELGVDEDVGQRTGHEREWRDYLSSRRHRESG